MVLPLGLTIGISICGPYNIIPIRPQDLAGRLSDSEVVSRLLPEGPQKKDVEVQGLGVWGLGYVRVMFEVRGSRLNGLGFRTQGLGIWGFRVEGPSLGFRV